MIDAVQCGKTAVRAAAPLTVGMLWTSHTAAKHSGVLLMADSLNKPDEAHLRQKAAETKARIVMHTIWTLYAIAGVLTLLFQLSYVQDQCTSIHGCGIGIVKAIIWTFLWPFYWMYYSNG